MREQDTTSDAPAAKPRVLITAGPTREPIDAVRFIGNRSSGRLGLALAQAAHDHGAPTTLLLGPTDTGHDPDTPATLHRFQTASDLETLLDGSFPAADILIMAAAVADFRPKHAAPYAKLRRAASGLTLELEPTPDLVAGVAAKRRPNQMIVGFALEPAHALPDSALAKLERKRLDAVVANPLETMDASDIDASVCWHGGRVDAPGAMSKPAFADWLIGTLMRPWHAGRDSDGHYR